MGALKDSVLTELSAINWPTVESSQWQDKSYQAIADGIFNYVDAVEANALVVCTATGTITPPVPPSAYAGACSVSITYLTADALKTLLLASMNTGSSVPGTAILGMFSALGTWLVAPVMNVTGWVPESVGILSGVGVAAYPLMAAQGAVCQSAMLGTKPATLDDSWTILETSLLVGLAGILTAAAVVGTVGPAAFTGASAGTIVYS